MIYFMLDMVDKSPSASNSFSSPFRSIYFIKHSAGLSISANCPGKDKHLLVYRSFFELLILQDLSVMGLFFSSFAISITMSLFKIPI